MNSLETPPFVPVQGVINIRCVGGFDVGSGKHVKPALIYRSGALGMITARGIEQLTALRISKAFDFRSESEIESYRMPAPVIPGLEIVKVPITEGQVFDPAALALRLQSFAEHELDAFLEIYTEILELGGPAFETIFRHIIAHPDEPFLVHCTAGKDRTGIFIAILLMILGVDDQAIIDDYALTTAGLEPVLPLLIKRFEKDTVYMANWQGTLNMGSSRPETMAATIEIIRSKYGGAENYLKIRTTLNEQDIQKVCEHLVV